MASIYLRRVNGYTDAKALYQFMMNAWDVLQEMIHFTEGASQLASSQPATVVTMVVEAQRGLI